jgi:hypothetical protein
MVVEGKKEITYRLIQNGTKNEISRKVKIDGTYQLHRASLHQ